MNAQFPRHIVYLTTNLVNGNVYVGVHTQKKERDYYLGSGNTIKAAIKKYGEDNFLKENLYICETREEALELEKLLVTQEWVKCQTTYNCTCGGRGNAEDHKLSTGQKMSLARRGEKNPFYGKKLSPESIEKMRKKKIGKKLSEEQKKFLSEINSKENHPQYGQHRSEETKRKISEANKGRKLTEEQKQKLSSALKGKYVGEKNHLFGTHLSEETKKKLSELRKGENNSQWGLKGELSANFGKKRTDKQRENMKIAQKLRRERLKIKLELEDEKEKGISFTDL